MVTPPFDVRTLLFVFTLVRVGQALALLHVWRTHSQYPPARAWALGALLSAAGALLAGGHPQLPPWASGLTGNLLGLTGWAMLDLGIVRALGRRIAPGWQTGALALAWALCLWQYLAPVHAVARVLVFHGAILLFDAFAAFACLTFRCEGRTSTIRIVGVAILMTVLSATWRLGWILQGGSPDLLAPGLAQSQYYIAMIFFQSVAVTMLVLFTSQQRQDEISNRSKELLDQRESELDSAQLRARTDSLTGLANRRHFDEALAAEFYRLKRSGAPLSLIMMDVDHFKNFNDAFGHLAGDDCLRQVAAALTAVVERAPDLVARYGGEEIAVILPETAALGAATLAERLRAAVQDLAIPHGESTAADFVTVSLGVVTITPADLHAPEQVLAMADEALYRAKQGGRNQVAYA